MRFLIDVRPRSKQSTVLEKENGDLKVFVKSPAKEGKANAEAAALIAKHFGVPKSCVTIVKGLRGHQKTVEILH